MQEKARMEVSLKEETMLNVQEKLLYRMTVLSLK